MSAKLFFFKKSIPQTPVTLSNNAKVEFATFDAITGYFCTNNEFVGGELKRCIEEQRYGISEISEEEFHRDYVEVKKKGVPLAKPPSVWQREQVGSKGYESGTHPKPVEAPRAESPSVVVADLANEALRIEDPPPALKPIGADATPKGPAPTPAVGSRSRPPIKPI